MLYSVAEPKKKRARRLLEQREPKVHENEKNALFVTGRSVSATVKDWLKDIYALKAPNAVKLNRKNDILPFEDESKLEFLSLKNDCSVFMVGNHSKKRPNNIVMGRLYDFRVLDILEFGFDNFKPMHSFSGPAPGIGMRPCFVFCGEDFETKPEFKKVANIFLDFFRGRTTSMINLKGLEHVIVMTALEGVVYFRHYAVALQKSGSALPRVELQELGPSFDLRIRRTKFASEESWKEATKQHALIKPKSKKNIERDSLGQTLGNVHVGRQDLTTLVTKKGRALRRGRDEDQDDDSADTGSKNSGGRSRKNDDGDDDDDDDGDKKGSAKKGKNAKKARAADPTDI